MRPSITTVLSARPWEPALTRLATATALARVVGRAWEPATVDASSPDVVVIGVETAWLSRALVQSWQRVGRAVVGVHGRGSPAERQALAGLGVDHAIGDGDV